MEASSPIQMESRVSIILNVDVHDIASKNLFDFAYSLVLIHHHKWCHVLETFAVVFQCIHFFFDLINSTLAKANRFVFFFQYCCFFCFRAIQRINIISLRKLAQNIERQRITILFVLYIKVLEKVQKKPFCNIKFLNILYVL